MMVSLRLATLRFSRRQQSYHLTPSHLQLGLGSFLPRSLLDPLAREAEEGLLLLLLLLPLLLDLDEGDLVFVVVEICDNAPADLEVYWPLRL